jgi:hypothetical protein
MIQSLSEAKDTEREASRSPLASTTGEEKQNVRAASTTGEAIAKTQRLLVCDTLRERFTSLRSQ